MQLLLANSHRAAAFNRRLRLPGANSVADEPRNGLSTEELTAILREVRDRVRARHPQSSGGPAEVPLPDLMPLVRARDAAEGKVAAIGTVNPRRGGPLNALVQFIKTMVARRSTGT